MRGKQLWTYYHFVQTLTVKTNQTIILCFEWPVFAKKVTKLNNYDNMLSVSLLIERIDRACTESFDDKQRWL